MPALYFLGSRLLGSSPAPAMWDDTQVESRNIAMFCPICGEIWGRVLQSPGGEWIMHTTTCEKDYSRSPSWCKESSGSFIAPWRRTFQELPPEVLEYEAKLRLDREPV